ncbi:hypothetical protein J437_LFUL010060 [Ladona fulva]|uniref:Uncharacterized protein n=1 Tax=Ladona fulva TaxID=123851 RepID=A0A8K0K6X0_LADFU|nr:hypothetical protein J437_LFUL010060 [Ladona fulva]
MCKAKALLAAEELLLEAKRGLARANELGAYGWKPCPLPGANKKFLHNTLRNVVSSNNLKEQKIERNLKKSKYLLRKEYVSPSEKKTESTISDVIDGRKKIHESRKDKDEEKKKNSPDQRHHCSHRSN